MIFLSLFTTTHTMQAEARARAMGLQVTLMPTPRKVGGSCSLSLRFGGADPEADGQAFFTAMDVPCALYRLEEETLACLAKREPGT